MQPISVASFRNKSSLKADIITTKIGIFIVILCRYMHFLLFEINIANIETISITK